jgi:outer membrane receptor protein involved in Fe transport
MRKTLIYISILLFLGSNIYSYELNGKVFIKDSNIPVKRVKVIAKDKNSITNNKGEFKINDINGTSVLKFRKKGYEPFNVTLNISQNLDKKFELKLKRLITVNTQKVYADKEQEKIAFYKVNQKAVKRLSESALFADAVTSLQMLPGVACNGSFDATMYIRGGNSYEIIGILDNTPIYKPYFFGGRLSIFNPKLIENIDFYPGGYDARANQSLSGIIDVKTKDGNYQEFEGEIEINLTDMNSVFSMPIEKDKSSLLVSYRRSWYDLLISAMASESDSAMALPFIEAFQSKYTNKLTKDHKLTINLAGFHEGVATELSKENSNDSSIEGEWNYDSKRIISSIQLDSIINKELVNNITFSYNKWDAFYKLGGDMDMDSEAKAETITIRDDLTYELNDSHKLQFGGLFYKYIDNEKMSWVILPNPYEAGSVTRDSTYTINDTFSILGAYIQDVWTIDPKHKLTFGGRLDYTQIGDYRGNPIFHPRLSYLFEYDKDTKFKAYYGKYSQMIVKSSYNSINGSDVAGSLADVRPEIAYHYGAGVERYLAENTLFKAEVFYKDYTDMIIDSGSYLENDYSNIGQGKASGLEVMLQKFDGKDFEGWLTYTYSKTERKDALGWYVPDYDVTHMINLYGDIKVKDKESLILAVKYSSGRPYTPIDSFNVNQTTGSDEVVEGEYNSARLPDYFRVDLWYEWQLDNLIVPIPFFPSNGEKAFGIFPTCKGKLRLGAYNVLGTKNKIGEYWDSDTNSQAFILDLPFLPVFGITYEF